MSDDIENYVKEEKYKELQPKMNEGLLEALDSYIPTWEQDALNFDDVDSLLNSKNIKLENKLLSDGTIKFTFKDKDTEEILHEYLK